jgi:hypothetical protein
MKNSSNGTMQVYCNSIRIKKGKYVLVYGTFSAVVIEEGKDYWSIFRDEGRVYSGKSLRECEKFFNYFAEVMESETVLIGDSRKPKN